MDRGYVDFTRLYRFTLAAAFFVTRAKSNTKLRRLYSRAVDQSTGLRCDQTVVLTGVKTPIYYPEKLRRIKYYDETTDQTFVFLTNNFTLPALTISELYRCKWQVELFFTWIKQHLRIKVFFGTSKNAVKSQIWIAVSTYLLVAILKKRLDIDNSLYSLLQILSLTLFERTRINQLLMDADYKSEDHLRVQQVDFVRLNVGTLVPLLEILRQFRRLPKCNHRLPEPIAYNAPARSWTLYSR